MALTAPPVTRPPEALPELAAVYWRRPASELTLRRSARLWTLTTLAHSVPFALAAALLGVLSPATLPLGAILLAHAWIIPELYAARGANVLRVPRRAGGTAAPGAEGVAMLLLGDLVSDGSRRLHAETGLITEPGRFGTWVLGQAGAVLVRPGGRRVHCFCVRTTDPELPAGDRIAHLLLALRTDESGFATVANQAFSGAAWRLRRRVDPRARAALQQAVAEAREGRAGREEEPRRRLEGAAA